MKKRILSLVLCVAMLLSMCLFMGAGVTGDTYKVTVNYIYESDSSPVAQATVLQVAKDDALTKEVAIPTQANYTPKLADGTPSEIALDVDGGLLKFTGFKPTGNVTVNVIYVAGNAKYTVNHYLQNLEDDKYTLKDTVEMTGSIDAYTEAVAKKYDGFTAGEVARSPIAADGTTVVDIKYTRNYYMVQFDANGGVNGPEPVYAKYGTEYTIPTGENAPTKQGYNFNGWWSDGKLLTTGKVEGNVTYTADWRPASEEASVTVVYWGQNANDNEYSYYGAAELTNQKVGGSLAWNDVKDMTAYTCGLEEHTHTSDCKLNCVHAHDATCYGSELQEGNPSSDELSYFTNRLGLQDGCVYHYHWGYGSKTDNYYLYLNGKWYKSSSSNTTGSPTKSVIQEGGVFSAAIYVQRFRAKLNCTHKHTAACYSCGKIEHTHSADCKKSLNAKMDSSLWEYEKSDTVTVDAAGNTIMNVSYTRKEFTLHFRKKNSNNDDDGYGTIKARWGKDISKAYKEKVNAAGSSFWSENRDASGPWTNYIGVMPQRNIIYYKHTTNGSLSTMTYYGEDLNGNYQEMFHVTFNGDVVVTPEDRYEFEGFTYHHGTGIGYSCNGAKFYYKRNTYSLNFYSASSSQSDRTNNVQFQEPLGSYDYTPTNKPKSVESDAVFVGWFYKDNGTEKPFSFEMGITKNYDLYPKWSNEVNVNYTIQYVVERLGDVLGTDTGSARIGTSVTVKSKPFDGYFPKTTSTSVRISQDGQVITLYYVPATEQTYTVKYVELVNGVPRDIADSETKTTRDQQVVVPAKDVEGFTPDKYQKTLELTAGGENVVTFYYTKQVTINYVPVGGGTVAPGAETLIRTTGEAQGSTATPDASYKFVGWYDNQKCTGEPVSKEAKFVPQQENGVYKEATYYAKFELDVFDLTIKKAGKNIDQNQIFVFHVVSRDQKTDMEVTVQGAGSVTIKGLPLGTTYTVTEDTNWTWQYKPDKSEEVFTPSGDYSVTFTNTYSKSNWLTSFAEVINKWIDGKIDPIKVKN